MFYKFEVKYDLKMSYSQKWCRWHNEFYEFCSIWNIRGLEVSLLYTNEWAFSGKFQILGNIFDYRTNLVSCKSKIYFLFFITFT